MRLENKSLCFTFGIDDVNVIEDDDRFAQSFEKLLLMLLQGETHAFI